jgi:hypothetical protein
MGDCVGVRERRFSRVVEVDGPALYGTAAVSLCLGRIEVQLIALSAAAFVATEGVLGLFSAVPAQGVLGSGEALGRGAFVGGAASVPTVCVPGT